MNDNTIIKVKVPAHLYESVKEQLTLKKTINEAISGTDEELKDFYLKVKQMEEEGTDLDSAVHFALFDINNPEDAKELSINEAKKSPKAFGDWKVVKEKKLPKDGMKKVEEDLNVRPFDYGKELPTKSYKPNQVKMQDIINFVKQYPGITTKELATKAYGNYDYGDREKVLQGAQYMIDRAVQKGAIVKVKDIKVGKAVYTYFTPEDYEEFLQKKKSMNIGNITMKETQLNSNIKETEMKKQHSLDELKAAKAKIEKKIEEMEKTDNVNENILSDPNFWGGVVGMALGSIPFIKLKYDQWKSAKTPEEKKQLEKDLAAAIQKKMGGGM